MKDKDYNMLQEAYTQVNENLYGRPEAKFIDMEDGRQMRDLEELDKQALFMYVMERPKLKEELNYLIGTGNMAQVSKWIETLEKSQNVISNGLQKSYLFDVAKEELQAKRAKTQEKPNISSLAKQDPREVEGYGRTFGEDIEWHNLGGETGPSPDMGDVLRSAKPMNPEEMDKPDIQQDFVDFVDKYSLDWDDLAKAVAQLLKDHYGTHNYIKFITLLDKELKQ